MQLYGFADPSDSLAVELYTTSTASNIKTKKDCNRMRNLLIAKKVPFVEIDLALHLWRRAGMLKASDGVDTLPQLHSNGKFVGDLAQVQEMEDFGELNDALKPDASYLSGISPATSPAAKVKARESADSFSAFPYVHPLFEGIEWASPAAKQNSRAADGSQTAASNGSDAEPQQGSPPEPHDLLAARADSGENAHLASDGRAAASPAQSYSPAATPFSSHSASSTSAEYASGVSKTPRSRDGSSDGSVEGQSSLLPQREAEAGEQSQGGLGSRRSSRGSTYAMYRGADREQDLQPAKQAAEPGTRDAHQAVDQLELDSLESEAGSSGTAEKRAESASTELSSELDLIRLRMERLRSPGASGPPPRSESDASEAVAELVQEIADLQLQRRSQPDSRSDIDTETGCVPQD